MRLRLAGIRRREGVLAELQLGAELERAHHLVDLVERGHRRGAGGGEHHEETSEQEALPESGAGNVLEHQAIFRRRAASRSMNSTSAARYWPSDRIDTHSSGPWWPSPDGPHSTAGTPASRNEIASEAPSRPTPSRSLVGSATRPIAVPSA